MPTMDPPKPTPLAWKVYAPCFAFAVIGIAGCQIASMDDASLAQKFRLGFLWLIALVSLMYQKALFVDPSVLFSADLCVAPDPAKTPAETWAKTPADAKFTTMSCAAWFCCFALLQATVLLTDPSCAMALARGMMVVYLWFQVVWYLCCLGKVEGKSAADYAKKETGMELFMAVLSCYFGFFVPK